MTERSCIVLGQIVAFDRIEEEMTAIQQCPDPDMEPQTTEKPFNFLALPGEIRNRIYDFIFEPQEFELNWLTRSKDLTYRTLESCKTPDSIARDWKCHRQLIFQRSPNITLRRRQLDLPRRLKSPEADKPPYNLSPGPAAILLTCRQIHSEANVMFYGNHAFHFHTGTVLLKFLNSLTKDSKTAIKTLCLSYRPAYGTSDESYLPLERVMNSLKWGDVYKKVARDLTHLEGLSIRTAEAIPSPKRDFEDSWAGPWFVLRPSRLRRVEVQCDRKDKTVAESLKMKLETSCTW